MPRQTAERPNQDGSRLRHLALMAEPEREGTALRENQAERGRLRQPEPTRNKRQVGRSGQTTRSGQAARLRNAAEPRASAASLAPPVARYPGRPAGLSRQSGTQARTAVKRIKPHQMDIFLLVLVVALCAVGLVVLYDVSYYRGLARYSNGAHFLKQQMYGIAAGFAALIVFSRVDYHFWQKDKVVAGLVGIAVVALGLVFLIGKSANGATRWFVVAGVSVQPSEIAKFAIIVFMAWHLTRNRTRIKQFLPVFGLPILVVGLMLGLIIAQPNLSTCVHIVGAMLIIFIAGGCNMKYIYGVGGAAALSGVVLIATAGYRMKRWTSFINPWSDPQGDAYQVIQSLYALGTGGLFGVGFGNSRQKFGYLPFAESDFVFAIIGEEFGLVGAIALIALFALLAWRGMRIALASRDRFGSLLATGITAMVILQVIINICVVTASIPATGLPLPFVSAGGTSLAILLGEIGILLNISRQVRTKE